MKVAVTPFIGQHCETTVLGTLLNPLDLHFSEPMLFGLGEALGFVYWNMKGMITPIIGGRVKPDLLTANVSKNLALHLEVRETASTRKAWEDVKRQLDRGRPVGLKLDCYHLEYFTHPIHFAGHYVAMLGYDDRVAFLVDTAPQGTEVRTSLESLQRARNEKGPMSSRNLSYTIERRDPVTALKDAVANALRSNARAYLTPPIQNVGFKGIEKASRELVRWFDRSTDVPGEFGMLAMMMERAGTGGALFRNLYRDFLKEAYAVTGDSRTAQAYSAFVDIARDWSEVIALIEQSAVTGHRPIILRVSEKMREIASAERKAMELLA